MAPRTDCDHEPHKVEDHRSSVNGQDDAALLPLLPLEPGAAGAEPAGLQPGEFVAAADVAQANRELVADELAATTGEDRRAAGKTCALLLATAGGRTSDAAAVRGDAGSDCSAPGTDGIDNGGQVRHRNRFTAGWGKETCCKNGLQMSQFRLCWYGSHTGSLHSPNVANRRDRRKMMPLLRSKRRFRLRTKRAEMGT